MGEAKQKKQAEEEQKTSLLREVIETIAYILVTMALVILIITYVGQRTVVNGDSMDNTLQDGQNLIMDKISYRFHDPNRFDIVIFPGPEEEGGDLFIKRVIGLPGETVQIIDGKVYINNEELTEDDYGITELISNPGSFDEPYTLGEEEYFCLGDNRPVSYDSRYPEVGPVDRSEIVGKVWIRIWPLSEFGSVKNGNVVKIDEEY